MVPDATTLPTALPLIVPNNTPETTATLAGPPRTQPTSAIAKSLKYSPALVELRNAAKVMNKTI